MILAFTLQLALYLIIVEHMPHLSISNNKKYCLSTTNVKKIQSMAAKTLSSYYVRTVIQNNNNVLIFVPLTQGVYSYKSKRTIKTDRVQKTVAKYFLLYYTTIKTPNLLIFGPSTVGIYI